MGRSGIPGFLAVGDSEAVSLTATRSSNPRLLLTAARTNGDVGATGVPSSRTNTDSDSDGTILVSGDSDGADNGERLLT